ncbi:hypothetical protein ACHELX_004376 [Vibrio vulnificus]
MSIKDILFESAEKARAILELHHKELNKYLFSSFPKAACGNTCELLAEWFIQSGIQDVTYVYGENTKLGSHAWLEIGDIVVDITADQFGTVMPKVYVGRKIQFYDNFSEQVSSEPSLQMRDEFEKFEAYMLKNA